MSRREFKEIYQVGSSEGGCSAQNEIQSVHLIGPPSSGSFTLTINGETTGSIDYDANNEAILGEIESLPMFVTNDIIITGGLPSALQIEFAGEVENTQFDIIIPNGNALEGIGVGIFVIANQRGRDGS